MANHTQHQKAAANHAIERLSMPQLPWYSKRLYHEHAGRYRFAIPYVTDKIVLDIACGTGYGSHMLAEAGAKKIIAIDNDPQAITYATKHFQHRAVSFSTGDAEKLDIASNSVDVLVTFETIEHLPHPETFIKEIHRVLKPGGTLILSTPNSHTSYGDNPYHLKEFTYTELKQLMKDFTEVTFYGQRRVHRGIIKFYKKFYKRYPVLRFGLRFRPWENIQIEKIDGKNTSFLYYLLVAKNEK